jgi:ferredoxin-nitrite reductase
VPRIARELGVFMKVDEALPVLRALLDAWQEDLRYRISRVKARIKFMVDDYGPEGMRAEIERRLGYALPDFALPPHPGTETDHLGLQPQKQDGLFTIGIPVHVGLITGDRMRGLAAAAEELGGDVRVTRQQNLVLTGVPEARLDATLAVLADLGFELDANPIRGGSIACTGEPHCNFSVTETKPRLDSLIQHLEQRFGDTVADLRLHLDGCPHACGQHWVGDIGFQGSTVRDEQGKRHQAYEIYLRGSLGREVAIGRPLFRRVPTYELDATVEGLVSGWLEQRYDGETFPAFASRMSDDELASLAGRPVTVRRGGGDDE